MKILRLIFRLFPATIKAIVIQSYYTLNGRRFDDLKRWIANNNSDAQANHFIVQESYGRLSNSKNLNRSPKLAIVSATPPADTGISHCTIETYRHSEFEIDIYSVFSTNDDYLSTVYTAEIVKSRTRIYDLDTLPFGISINDYKAIVFTLGNSYHNLPYMLSLLKFTRRSSEFRVYIHLHDPVIFNLLRITCHATGKDFIVELEKSYGKLRTEERIRTENQDYSPLLERGICGIYALLADINIGAIFVNSVAGENLLHADFKNCFDHRSEIPIKRLFHPIFPPMRLPIIDNRLSNVRIGTFGLPDRAKRTEVVVEAFRLLRKRLPDAELLIAGYNAGQYAKYCNLSASEGILVLDSPSDFDLQRAMRSCHLGVQLRNQNTGESSGVVPQLLANHVPVIVSSVGAFAEYGDAVRCVSVDISADELFRSIMEELRIGGRRDEPAKRLIIEHNPAQFCTELLELVSTSTLHLVVDKQMQKESA